MPSSAADLTALPKSPVRVTRSAMSSWEKRGEERVGVAAVDRPAAASGSAPTSRVCHSSVTPPAGVRLRAVLPAVLADRRQDQAVRQLQGGDVGGRFGGADTARGGGGARGQRVRRQRGPQRRPVQQTGDGERDPRPVRRHVERQPARRGRHATAPAADRRPRVPGSRSPGTPPRRRAAAADRRRSDRAARVDDVERAVVADHQVGQGDVEDQQVLRSEHPHRLPVRRP